MHAFAHHMPGLVDDRYPEAEWIDLVLDHLNTPKRASLYEAFPSEEAHLSARKIALSFHPEAWQLAHYGRNRVQRPASSMSGPPHPRGSHAPARKSPRGKSGATRDQAHH